MYSISSIVGEAYALQEAHTQLWSSRTTPRHPHGTRAEKKRINQAVKERDITFLNHYLDRVHIMEDTIEHARVSIIVFTYLTELPYLLQFETFRKIVWEKMNELETAAGQQLDVLHRIISRAEFEEQEKLCQHLHALFHVIWHLRAAMRQ